MGGVFSFLQIYSWTVYSSTSGQTIQSTFGHFGMAITREIIDLPYLVLSSPYSNGFYFQVYKSQNRECFLEGLKRIFHKMGGVQKAIRFDNLATLKKVLPNGERELAQAFLNFVFH